MTVSSFNIIPPLLYSDIIFPNFFLILILKFNPATCTPNTELHLEAVRGCFFGWVEVGLQL